MPEDRSPGSLTEISLKNSTASSEDRASEDTATVEIFRNDSMQGSLNKSSLENVVPENFPRQRANSLTGEKKFNGVAEVPYERRKSGGISKGVILNAMHFGSYDLNCKPNDLKEKAAAYKEQEMCENGSPPKALEASNESAKAAEAEESKEKKEMSFSRKIAFGCSFLPSVMFVLAFAVILPCEDYKPDDICVKNKWSLLLNNTEITYELSLPGRVLLGYHYDNSTILSDGLMNVNDESGESVWKVPLESFPKNMICGDLDADKDGTQDCLTATDDGTVYAFNLTNGNVFWKLNLSQSPGESVLFPECPNKGFTPVSLASYRAEGILSIDVINEVEGTLLYTKKVTLDQKCSTFTMKPWKHESSIDLVFFCKTEETAGSLYLVKQSEWCQPDSQNIILPQPLLRFRENDTGVSYLPTSEGLVVWSGNEVTFLQSDGSFMWQDSTPLVPQVRMIQVGSFYIGGQQIALIGQNGTAGVEVLILTSDEGKELRAMSLPNKILSQAVVIPGNETDTLLLSVLEVKITETEQLADNVLFVSNVSSSSNFRTDAPYKINGKQSVVEQLMLFQFGEKNATYAMYENEVPISCSDGGVCESAYQASRVLTASSEQKDDSTNLQVVLLRTEDTKPGKNGSGRTSRLNAFDITHSENMRNTPCRS